MTIVAKSIPASIKDVDGELIVGEKRKPIKLGTPTEVGIRGENVDLHFTVPNKHWHHLRQATMMRTRLGTKSFVTFCPAQTIPSAGTMSIIQRVRFYAIRPAADGFQR